MEKTLKRWFPLFGLPTLAAFTVGFLVPFVMGLALSFCRFTTVSDARFVGLANYKSILGHRAQRDQRFFLAAGLLH